MQATARGRTLQVSMAFPAGDLQACCPLVSSRLVEAATDGVRESTERRISHPDTSSTQSTGRPRAALLHSHEVILTGRPSRSPQCEKRDSVRPPIHPAPHSSTLPKHAFLPDDVLRLWVAVLSLFSRALT